MSSIQPCLQVVLVPTLCFSSQQEGRSNRIQKSKRVERPASAFAVSWQTEFPGPIAEQSHQSSEAHGKHLRTHVSLAELWAEPAAAAPHSSDGTAESKTAAALISMEAFLTDAWGICWSTGKIQTATLRISFTLLLIRSSELMRKFWLQVAANGIVKIMRTWLLFLWPAYLFFLLYVDVACRWFLLRKWTDHWCGLLLWFRSFLSYFWFFFFQDM